jgi:hypothetical protein
MRRRFWLEVFALVVSLVCGLVWAAVAVWGGQAQVAEVRQGQSGTYDGTTWKLESLDVFELANWDGVDELDDVAGAVYVSAKVQGWNPDPEREVVLAFELQGDGMTWSAAAVGPTSWWGISTVTGDHVELELVYIVPKWAVAEVRGVRVSIVHGLLLGAGDPKMLLLGSL